MLSSSFFFIPTFVTYILFFIILFSSSPFSFHSFVFLPFLFNRIILFVISHYYLFFLPSVSPFLSLHFSPPILSFICYHSCLEFSPLFFQTWLLTSPVLPSKSCKCTITFTQILTEQWIFICPSFRPSRSLCWSRSC